jgi:hypothetical protein
MTVQMIVDDRRNRRVMAELMRGIVGHDALGLERGPKELYRDVPLIIVLEDDKSGLASVDDNVFSRTILQTKIQASAPPYFQASVLMVSSSSFVSLA